MTPAALADAGLTLDMLQQLLYQDIDGYTLASTGRERTDNFGESFTYGDITPEVVHQMLSAVGARPGDRFYDLGSGTGKGVIFAHMLFDLGHATGIELIEELNEGAAVAASRYHQQVLPLLPQKNPDTLRFVQGDMQTHDLSDANIIFAHCTCFAPELMNALMTKFLDLQSGARIITVSKEMNAEHLIPIGSESCRMAWGAATLYFYERL